MASSGGRIAWGFTRFIVGFVLWGLAGLFVVALADGAMPLWAAITAATLVVLGLPSLLTRLLLPAFRRLGENARWYEVWPGLCGVVAILTLVLPLLLARGWVSARLHGVSTRHASGPRWVVRGAEGLSRWLAPALPTTGPNGGVLRADAGVLRDVMLVDGAAPDAAILAPSDASDNDSAAIEDASDSDDAATVDAATDDAATDDAVTDATASDDAADDSDDEDASIVADAVAQAPSGPPVDPRANGTNQRPFARFSPCDSPRQLWMGELALGGSDEVVLTCGDSVRVYFLQNDGVVERTTLRPNAPAGQSLVLGRTLVSDLDGDGRRDLGLCAYFTTERGGTRGGGLHWARGRANGQFDAPRVLVPSMDCAGVELGDVNGDNRPDLVVVKENNGYAQTGRDSELLWYAGQGAQWALRGRVRLSPGASSLWLEDVTRDGILDAIVHAGWDGQSHNWVVAGARRGPSGVVTVEDVGTLERSWVQGQGRLDGDGQTDVVRIEANELRFWRTADDGRAERESATRALDYEEYRY